MTEDWPRGVEDVLVRSGWTPGRFVDVSRWRDFYESENLQMHAAAQSFLEEFGGLTIDIRGPGVTRALVPIRFDPELCDGEGGRFLGWSKRVGHRILPIGDLDLGRFFLGIDENGTIYLVETWVGSYGTGRQALVNLIEGYASEVVAE